MDSTSNALATGASNLFDGGLTNTPDYKIFTTPSANDNVVINLGSSQTFSYISYKLADNSRSGLRSAPTGSSFLKSFAVEYSNDNGATYSLPEVYSDLVGDSHKRMVKLANSITANRIRITLLSNTSGTFTLDEFRIHNSPSLITRAFETVALLNSGSDDKRINIVILGEGYDASEQAKFITDATKIKDDIFATVPYSNYKNYFNVYAIKVISPESGIKHPGTGGCPADFPSTDVRNPNNYFGCSFDGLTGLDHGDVIGHGGRVYPVLAANTLNYDIVLVLLNINKRGGVAQNELAWATTYVESSEIAIHEIGRSFGDLGDEYFGNSSEKANRTANSDPLTIKWKNWLGINGIGIYEYGTTPSTGQGLFKPSQTCKMQVLWG